ncbi:preprotein translocase subunit SCY1, chloroplastic isoform X3 [Durio zibethinus]|uniref:Preprotein translocase subunit SCY1, chloroplastic isoform X3 n=1 Tax=Durio zibethinus TaxID=66656 RepID=A0A6P5XU10_DURZI|nr:preprotein translocase subunit SCY1, chloroplastic isoform X3 [Durio zibethinus]
MLITVREASSWPLSFNLSSFSYPKPSPTLKNYVCRASLTVHRKPNSNSQSWNCGLLSNGHKGSVFDPLVINPDVSSRLNGFWESFLALLTPTFESTSGTRKEKSSSARGVAAAIEDSSIDFGDFFKGPLPGKFLKLLAFLGLSRLGVYIPLGGVNREAFVGNLDENSLLSTLDSFSGGGIGRLEKRRRSRKKESSSVYQICFSWFCYSTASFGRTVAQAYEDGNYIGLLTIIISFFLLVLGIVYVQEAERKIPINYASRYTSRSGGHQKSAYLPFKVNSSGVMPIIFSTSSLALPGTLARFTGISVLKKAAVALNPGGSLYLPTNILLIAFFNYYYTFLQLDPDDVSEQLKRQGASIPLVRPGKSTAAFLKTVLSRISVLGSVFLAILAAGPAVIEQTTHLTVFRGFAGTSVLILVGCATDTARKVQAEIISQKYNIEFYDLDRYGP